MRTHGERVVAAMVIEIAGPPGAGKTSLLPAILRTCEAVGLRPYTVEGAARVFAQRTAVGRVAALLPAPLRRKALWAIFLIGSAAGAARLARRQPALARHVVRTQRRRPTGADAAERRVLYWYFRTAGAYDFLRRHACPGEAVIIDEGFVHRTVQLHASSVEQPEPQQVAAYVRSVPRADLTVVVHAPADICQQRVRDRGVWARLRHRGPEEIDRFVANAHLAITLATDALRDGVAPVLEIDNADDLASAEIALKTQLPAALPGVPSRRPARWAVPRLRLPRASRLVDQARARSGAPLISPGTCARVLEHYRLSPSRQPRNLAFGRRNHNVVITAPAGRMVLRRYRQATPPASVTHEHEVLAELERRAFPAVRVQRTVTGGTVVVDGGHLYALFAFEPGRNLSSYVLPGQAARDRLMAAAGGTLARLHDELAGFHAATAHHLGYDPASSARVHDLDWYIEQLTDLSERDPAVGTAAPDHHRGLAGRSAELGAWLTDVHEGLEHAPLRQVVIHGDYGMHNLLLRRDGVAVVGDFELARREWRLVDLIIVLSRLPLDQGRAFVAGYCREAAIPADEWRHISAVWQYYRLTGAIHSWRNHFLHGGEQRLATAHRRVAEAEWARAKVESLWP